jgi:hypothetical protein
MGRNLELALQPLALETIQTIMPIIPITRIAPTQTPASKMSPTSSQPIRLTEKIGITKKNQHCFIGVLQRAVSELISEF